MAHADSGCRADTDKRQECYITECYGDLVGGQSHRSEPAHHDSREGEGPPLKRHLNAYWRAYLEQFAGAGATVPLTGFGHALAKGVREAVDASGWRGIFTGGLTATAGGIAAAIVFSLIAALFARPRMKR